MSGSVQIRGNSALLTVSSGKGLGGKRSRKTKTVSLEGYEKATEKQLKDYLEDQLAVFRVEVKSGQVRDGDKTTFKDFTERWIKEYADPKNKNLEQKTFHRYKEMLDSRIVPAMGHIKLGELSKNPLILLEFYNNLRENGIRLDTKYRLKSNVNINVSTKELSQKACINIRTVKNIINKSTTTKNIARKISSALNMDLEQIFNAIESGGGLDERTILHHHKLISSMMNKAVMWQLIKENPAKFVDAPHVDEQESKSYNADQSKRLISALDCAPFKYKVIIVLTVHTGVREGELMGLEWSDIDFDNNIVRLKQASQYIPGSGTFTKDKLKTKSSKREFYMPDYIMDLLRSYQKWQKAFEIKHKNKWIKSERLFTQNNGLPMHPYTPTKWLPDFINTHNKKIHEDEKIKESEKNKYLLPELNFHGLRHTNISLLLRAGLDVPTVSKWAGHSRKSTTLDRYAHTMEVVDKRPAAALEKIFNESHKVAKRYRVKKM